MFSKWTSRCFFFHVLFQYWSPIVVCCFGQGQITFEWRTTETVQPIVRRRVGDIGSERRKVQLRFIKNVNTETLRRSEVIIHFSLYLLQFETKDGFQWAGIQGPEEAERGEKEEDSRKGKSFANVIFGRNRKMKSVHVKIKTRKKAVKDVLKLWFISVLLRQLENWKNPSHSISHLF